MQITKGTKYQWNPGWGGAIAHDVDIEKVIDEIDSIQESFGKVTPELLVESSKNKSSSLHKFFEWDDAKAATIYRKGKASEILRHIEVKVVKDGKPFFVRAYELTSRFDGDNFKGEVKYNKFETLTDVNIQMIRKIVVSDLGRLLKKVRSFDTFKGAVPHIEKAIEELSKESTETKEPSDVLLKAVG